MSDIDKLQELCDNYAAIVAEEESGGREAEAANDGTMGGIPSDSDDDSDLDSDEETLEGAGRPTGLEVL